MTHDSARRCCKYAVLPLLALLGGCNGASLDPYQRTDVWIPEGANDGNLAAMVVNPNDLIRGQSDSGPRSKMGTTAVERLWRGEVGGAAAGNMGGGGGAGAAPGGGGGAATGGGASAGASP